MPHRRFSGSQQYATSLEVVRLYFSYRQASGIDRTFDWNTLRILRDRATPLRCAYLRKLSHRVQSPFSFCWLRILKHNLTITVDPQKDSRSDTRKLRSGHNGVQVFLCSRFAPIGVLVFCIITSHIYFGMLWRFSFLWSGVLYQRNVNIFLLEEDQQISRNALRVLPF